MNRGVLRRPSCCWPIRWTTVSEVDGKLGPMELQAMNRAIEPLVNARINTGRIDGMNFRIAGDSRQADVQLLLLYDSLNVSLMKQEKDGPKARPVAFGHRRRPVDPHRQSGRRSDPHRRRHDRTGSLPLAVQLPVEVADAGYQTDGRRTRNGRQKTPPPGRPAISGRPPVQDSDGGSNRYSL